MRDTVTVRHWGGQVESVPVEEARRLLRGGFIWLLSELPPVEAAMVAAPETAMLPAGRPRQAWGKPKKRKPRKKQV